MKKILNLYLIIFCTLFVAGCSCDDDATSVKLAIVKSDLDIKASGGVGSVEYVATGTVEATVNVDWCQVTEVTGTKVTVSVDANTGYPGRSAQLVLTDGVSTQQVTVLQDGAVWVYDKAETELRAGNEEEELPVEMSSNLPIEVIIPDEAKDWLSYRLTDEGFSFVVEKNETGSIRGTRVKVKTGERETSYTVMQYEVTDLLGEWGGVAYMLGMGLNGPVAFSPNPTITESAGEYNLFLPMEPVFENPAIGVRMKMEYNNGMFLVPIPQVQNFTMSGFYPILTAADDQSYYYSGQTLVIAPVLLDDGSVVLSCVSDIYFMLGFFTSTTPNNTSFTRNAIEFPIIQLYR